MYDIGRVLIMTWPIGRVLGSCDAWKPPKVVLLVPVWLVAKAIVGVDQLAMANPWSGRVTEVAMAGFLATAFAALVALSGFLRMAGLLAMVFFATGVAMAGFLATAFAALVAMSGFLAMAGIWGMVFFATGVAMAGRLLTTFAARGAMADRLRSRLRLRRIERGLK